MTGEEEEAGVGGGTQEQNLPEEARGERGWPPESTSVHRCRRQESVRGSWGKPWEAAAAASVHGEVGA